jgi:hypothetical protein
MLHPAKGNTNAPTSSERIRMNMYNPQRAQTIARQGRLNCHAMATHHDSCKRRISPDRMHGKRRVRWKAKLKQWVYEQC